MTYFVTVIFLLTILSAGCKTTEDVYSPKEWHGLFAKAGGWIPLPFPDSKYEPGAIITVSDDGMRWVDHLRSCRYPEEVLRVEESYIPGISFTHEKEFGANAIINIKGIEAGPGFDNISKIGLVIKDHGADAFRLINLKVWMEEPANRKTVSSACMTELQKPNHFLVTEAFRVSKGSYTLYNKSGAAIKLKTPVLENLLKFEPDVKYEVTTDGSLLIEKSAYFAVRRAVRVGNDFTVLGPSSQESEVADKKIEELYFKAAGE